MYFNGMPYLGKGAWDGTYNGFSTEKVFIDTEQLRHIGIFGCGTFLCQFYLSGVPRDRLVFQGENSHRIAPKGSMVVGPSPPCHCHCDGNCENCRCARKRKSA